MTVCRLVVNTLLGVGMQVVAEAVALGSTLELPRDLLFEIFTRALFAPPKICLSSKIETSGFSPDRSEPYPPFPWLASKAVH
jgi:3-hydroxyisobutyrate dehydrogenase-like beta-hydroxyacid dehydrogenase